MWGIVIIGVLVGIIVILRLFGAWMLRINEVITLQKEIVQELKRINKAE